MRITRRDLARGIGAVALGGTAASILPRWARAETAPIRSHGGSLIGALRYPPDFPHFGYVNPAAPRGGRVRVATQSSFDSFNPFIVRGDPPTGIGLIHDALMTASLDEGSTQYGLLAEWTEHPADYSWVSFKLREQARWHDGRPVTVDDVIFSFRALVEKGAPFYRFYYQNVTDVRDLGGGVVRFDFDKPGNRELPHIMGQLTILPKHYHETRAFDEPGLDRPLSCGPYRIGDYEVGRFIEYERVEDYWGADLPVNIGKNNFDRIRYEIFLDASAALDAFRGGLIDFREEFSAQNWAERYDFAAVRDGRVRKEEATLEGPKRVQTLVMNLRRPKFQNRNTRLALQEAFDFEWTNRTIYFEQYARPRSFFQGTEDLMPAGEPQGAERAMLEALRGQVPDEVFGPPFVPPVTDGSGRNRAGLRRAAALLESAGWRQGPGGALVDAEGRPFEIEFLSAQDAQERVIGPYIQNLRTLGINAVFRVVDAPQYIRRLSQDPQFDFDMVISGISNSESPGNEQREFWGSEAAGRMGSRNIAGVRDPAVDMLVDRIIFATDRETLAAATRALDRVLTWNVYSIFQLYTPFERFAYWTMFGHPEPLPARTIGFPTVWWVDPEKAAALERRG